MYKNLLNAFGYIPSLVDRFKAKAGNNTAANDAAISAYTASREKFVWVDRGMFETTLPDYLLYKPFKGPGQFKTSGGTYLPGNYQYLINNPQRGTGTDLNYYFSADLDFVNADYKRTAVGLRVGLNEPYFESATTPNFEVYDNGAGYGGVSAHLITAYVAGENRVFVNDTSEFTIGGAIGFNATQSLDSASYTDKRTVTAINAGTGQITFSGGPLSRGYPTDSIVSIGTRTMNQRQFTYLQHRVGGDSYWWTNRIIHSYSPKPGQTTTFETSTAGPFGGDYFAQNSGIYSTFFEWQFTDLGNDISVNAFPITFNRGNTTAAREARWGVGVLVSINQAVDYGFSFLGNWKVALDTVLGDFSYFGNTIINMKDGQGFTRDSTYNTNLKQPYMGDIRGKSWDGFLNGAWTWLGKTTGVQTKIMDLNSTTGVLTNQYRPKLLAYLATTQNLNSGAAFAPILFTATVDNRVKYNNATGEYEAIADGDYTIDVTILADGTSDVNSILQTTIYKNGVIALGDNGVFMQYTMPAIPSTVSSRITLTLVAGDKIQVMAKNANTGVFKIRGAANSQATRLSIRREI